MAGDKYQGGEDTRTNGASTHASFWSDPLGVSKSLLADYAAIRSKYSLDQLTPLVDQVLKKGEPLDDKKGTTEQLISILTLLPSGSSTRTTLTNKLIDTLWDNLQHPPLSYLGGTIAYEVVGSEKDTNTNNVVEFTEPTTGIKLRESHLQSNNGMYQYRTPDGSYNNILEPHIGKAGTPYAKSVRNDTRLQGVKPDPGLLFDLLMARPDPAGVDDGFRENPAGVSSMLFYHATIIIHDIFRTNRKSHNISDVSSYLDLAPLYGSSLAEQVDIRTMKEGKLKPDTFAEKRLLGQPPGVNVMLVMYNRFHNYVADVLLKINENGRFTLAIPPNATKEETAVAYAKQDHDLFNTARLIVGGMYVNISLHDYLRAITNTHHSLSDWTLDPRVEIDKHFDGEGVPRGIGNQVSVEFNLLYRFHSCISRRDERWTEDFFLTLFPDKKREDLPNISLAEVAKGLGEFEGKIGKQKPWERTFGDLKRQESGFFRDEDLVKILQDSMNDPAGTFGHRMVPKVMKIIEVMGIAQARKWNVASLNEFRTFFGLKKWEKFSDINSDPEIAKLLEQLYTDPDMVELYPGMMIENFKPAQATGCGICPTYTVGRAVLSDAVTLVRSDRFNTIDYTVANLTSWGFSEVKQDPKTLGGSMLYKLIQRALPGWFPYNSIAVMQPMYTKKANIKIAKELGTYQNYTEKDPEPPRGRVVLVTNAGVKKLLEDSTNFKVPWLSGTNDIVTSSRTFEWYCLAGDTKANFEQKVVLQKAFAALPNLTATLQKMVAKVGADLIKQEEFKLKNDLYQLDIIRDVAIPLNAQLLGDLFYFDLKGPENPGGKLSRTDVYSHILNIRTWGGNNNDPALAFNRRRRAQESCKTICDSTLELVKDTANDSGFLSALQGAVGTPRWKSLEKGSLRSLGYKLVQELLKAGCEPLRVVDNLWLTAFGGVATPMTTFCEVLAYFLKPENSQIWTEIQKLAASNDDAKLREYVVEGQRLTNAQRNVRVSVTKTEIEGKQISPGNIVIAMLGMAGRDKTAAADALEFKPGRQDPLVTLSSHGPHACIGREIMLPFVVGMIKLVAGLEKLRPALGQQGEMKTVQVGTERMYLNDNWSYLTFDPTTWKLHYSGHGQGCFTGQRQSAANLTMNQYEVGFLHQRHSDWY